MIDIVTYRSRIGLFSPVFRSRKSTFINSIDSIYKNKAGHILRLFQVLFKVLLLVSLLSNCYCNSNSHQVQDRQGYVQEHLGGQGGRLLWVDQDGLGEELCLQVDRKVKVNFLARYTFGNKVVTKGIKNLHVNIRSLANKISEVKNIVRDQKPHILGLSECELKKLGPIFDEEKLKIPRYDLVFPKS